MGVDVLYTACVSGTFMVWFCTEINVILILCTKSRVVSLLCVGAVCYQWRVPGVGKLSLSVCPGVGNRPPSKKKMANPRGMPGGMVTGGIEPYIMLTDEIWRNRTWHSMPVRLLIVRSFFITFCTITRNMFLWKCLCHFVRSVAKAKVTARDKVFIWENFHPGCRDLGLKNRDLGNRLTI